MTDQDLAKSLVAGWELVREWDVCAEYRTPGRFGYRYRVAHFDGDGAIITVTENGRRLIEPEE
jgi:hypothetical protein